MFTGLIEKVGILEKVMARGNGMAVAVSCGAWQEPLDVGESIAVNGACLTVTSASGSGFSADVLKETLERTSLKGKRKGSPLNLERALRSGDRMGGHMVSGHVDGVGAVSSLRRTGDDHVLRVSCSSDLIREIVGKGSIALEGISLTVSDIGEDWFEVHVIPHTWQHTSLNTWRTGDQVNIETDIVAKYIRKYMNAEDDGLSIRDRLNKAGFPVSGN